MYETSNPAENGRNFWQCLQILNEDLYWWRQKTLQVIPHCGPAEYTSSLGGK